MTPRPFLFDKPIVLDGESVTQGASASRSGMSYKAMLCRRINADFVNLGFSGNRMSEPVLVRTNPEYVDLRENLDSKRPWRNIRYNGRWYIRKLNDSIRLLTARV